MKNKKLLIGSLVAGAGLALALRAATRPAKPSKASSKVAQEAIDAYIEAQMRRLHIPGAALAIVDGQRIVHRRGFGRARPDGELPTPRTPFFIGSITKSMTALAVMQLVEAGKVELDAPVQRYLPWFQVADAQASALMTVRHLLNQASGLPFIQSEIALGNFDDSPGATERLVRSLATLKLNGPLGAKFEYSNHNYNTLGLVVEAASGVPYPEYIQGHIFDPLGMRHSYASKAEASKHGLAVGHRYWFSLPVPAPDMPVPVASMPSGQLISCAEDMAHYLIAHLNRGCYGEAQVLSGTGIETLHRGVKEYGLGNTPAGKYGMGWFEVDMGGTRVLEHGGNVPDFSAFMSLIPGQEKGLVLLFNADPYGLPFITEEVGMGATALMAGQQPAPIKLDFIQWVWRLLPLVPLLQVASMLATLGRLRRWERHPELRPAGGELWGRHILLPLIPNLALAGLLAYLRSSGLIRFIDLFMPDLAWVARISGGLGGIWAWRRTRLILQAARKPPASVMTLSAERKTKHG